jgi:translation elongation factor EF-Ts
MNLKKIQINSLKELKEYTTKYLDEIKKTVKDMRWELNKDTEIMKKTQIETLEKKSLINEIK